MFLSYFALHLLQMLHVLFSMLDYDYTWGTSFPWVSFLHFSNKRTVSFHRQIGQNRYYHWAAVAAMWKGASRAADATSADVVPTWH